MRKWARVKWTEAGQVADLLDWKDDLGPDARTPPEEFFGRLRGDQRLPDAVFFIGQALPRFETVVWAIRTVRDLGRDREMDKPDADALKAALLWVQDPSDQRRRAAYDAAQLAGDRSAERLAALAAFFSGGSLAPDNCPPVPTLPQASGQLAAGAVLLAAHQTPDWTGAINSALDAAETIAMKGVEAGAA